MFGRRRHEAITTEATLPPFDTAQVYELLQSRLADLVGAHGSWTIVRRTDEHTDGIFHELMVEQIAHELTQTLAVAATAPTGEPAALGWMPEPIAVWAEDEVEVEPAAMEELIDTTDTDANAIVPARHFAEASVA